MVYGSVCSGIGGASQAWQPLGWQAAWFSEIDSFANAVLAFHHPEVPNLGDMTFIHETKQFQRRRIDVLVGGTPCRSFSIVGMQRGLDDPDGRLALAFVGIAGRGRPRWVVWENVPGILSTHRGRDFGTILRALEEVGYGWAYRTLDAQYFGVPQRRSRIILVGHLGDWRPAAAVLFEPAGSARNTECSGQNGPEAEPPSQGGAGKAISFNLQERRTFKELTEVTNPLIRFQTQAVLVGGEAEPDSVRRSGATVALVASSGEVSRCLLAGGSLRKNPTSETFLVDPRSLSVRRLTALECERLQGYPDGYTLIPWRGGTAPDGLRCKALGNSFAVPVIRWVGRRIGMFEEVRARLAGDLIIRPTAAKPRIKRPKNNVVYTDPAYARRIVEYFRPTGFCLDPCRGAGAFYDNLPEPRDWCEIEQGRDFMAYRPSHKIDWIITNPPWAAAEYRPIVRRCFELADDVVLMVRLHNGLGTTARHADYLENGHRLKEIVVLPWDGSGFLPEGFTLAAMHWQRRWDGDCKWTYWQEEHVAPKEGFEKQS